MGKRRGGVEEKMNILCPKCNTETERPVKFGKEIICWLCYQKIPYVDKVKAVQKEN